MAKMIPRDFLDEDFALRRMVFWLAGVVGIGKIGRQLSMEKNLSFPPELRISHGFWLLRFIQGVI